MHIYDEYTLIKLAPPIWVVLVIKMQLFIYLAWIRTSVSRASVSCRVCMSRFSASPRKRSNLLRAEPWVFLSTISSSCRMVEFSSLMMKNIKKIYLFCREWNYWAVLPLMSYQPYYHELNLPEVEPVLVYLLGLKIHVSRRSLYPECEVSLQTQIGHLAGSYFCKIYQTNHTDEMFHQTIKKSKYIHA